jgi:hypothetical protein
MDGIRSYVTMEAAVFVFIPDDVLVIIALPYRDPS